VCITSSRSANDLANGGDSWSVLASDANGNGRGELVELPTGRAFLGNFLGHFNGHFSGVAVPAAARV